MQQPTHPKRTRFRDPESCFWTRAEKGKGNEGDSWFPRPWAEAEDTTNGISAFPEWISSAVDWNILLYKVERRSLNEHDPRDLIEKDNLSSIKLKIVQIVNFSRRVNETREDTLNTFQESSKEELLLDRRLSNLTTNSTTNERIGD